MPPIFNEAERGLASPTDLREAVEMLQRLLDPDELGNFSTLEEFRSSCHHGLGTGIRNNWGLWVPESALHIFFVEAGITHPDDMSGCILRAYWAAQKGKDFALSEEAERLRAYYDNRGY